ncbi:hypothetical protein KP509_32G041800 [Ceratopteris richardii]|uniref:E3 ubiquitin-protein ligase n=1 Tax=Ceratopteris richardii TaxID=49495 RepID=A0A8T2QUV7_CERRI|nr:hypothetical protein KP509_32G041800 [Ceratopteris richardii]
MTSTEEFVGRIVSRFGLNDYFSMFFHLPKEYEIALAKFMLTFLVQIVGERELSGFSVSQSCRRELIKRLAVSDATHSQLMKALPHRFLDDNQWQNILASVATYYQPSGLQQGRFSLRRECWNEVDLYHPRWNARDLQSAEDRYFHACKVSPVIKQVPQWQRPYAPFENLSKIATCKKVLDVLRSTFCHAVFSTNLSESCAPEDVLITALHLLALGLDICSLFSCRKSLDHKLSSPHCETSKTDPQMFPPLLANATEYVLFRGVNCSGISNHQNLLSLLVLLMRRYFQDEEMLEARGEPQSCNIGVLIKDLLIKFSNLHSGCMEEIKSLAPEILQRDLPHKDDNFKAQNGFEQSDITEANKKKLLARERQAEIMAKMRAAQEKFVSTFQLSKGQDGLDEEISEKKLVGAGFQSQAEWSIQTPVAVMCSLCRDSTSSSPTSFLTFVQRSKLLEIAQRGIPSWERRGKLVDAEMLDATVKDANEASILNSEEQEHIRAELLNLIRMALNGEVDQEGRPIEVEALLALLGDEEFNESFEGSESSLDIRMTETESFDFGSDGSAEDGDVLVRNESLNVPARCSASYSSLKGGIAEDSEDKKIRTRKNHLVTVLFEYANILSKKNGENHNLEIEESASSQTESGSRLVNRNVAQGLPQDDVGSNDSLGVHMSSCGHAVHQECLDRYLSSLRQRYQSRNLYEGFQIVDPNQREFLCPVCRRLANSVLPFTPEISVSDAIKEEQGIAVPCLEFSPPSSAKVNLVANALGLLYNAEELVWKSGFRKAIAKPLSRGLKAAFDSLFWKLFDLHFPGRGRKHVNTRNRVSQSLLLWNVLRYTVLSAELSCRSQEDAINSEHTLGVLLQHADENYILQVLLRAARVLQNRNRQSILLRARGMQLLVGAICLGVSEDSLTDSFPSGSVSKLLDLIENGKEAADISFWRRTADPVLAHDPFSSLLWIIFSLPLSVASCTEAFICLVHLLYLVLIFQIMASMDFVVLSKLSEMHLTSSTCTFLASILSNLTSVNVFHSKYDASESLSDSLCVMLRRFTLPYLRQCALLAKLCCVLDFSDSNIEKKLYSNILAGKHADSLKNGSIKDLKELEILEKGFSLPSLQMLLEDRNNQEIVFKWCNHICQVSGQRNILPIHKPQLAVPFKLMELPSLYQTLLQFYIKERCRVCLKVPEQPALCLLCGTLCCGLTVRPCCSMNSQSECFRHAVACNGGVAVFLMIKRTNVLLQRFARQAYWPSPYLDDFGEEDIDMRRGKPLRLNEERYAALTRMVISHGLDQSSLVLSYTTRETLFVGSR